MSYLESLIEDCKYLGILPEDKERLIKHDTKKNPELYLEYWTKELVNLRLMYID